jgi:hypothetical protein
MSMRLVSAPMRSPLRMDMVNGSKDLSSGSAKGATRRFQLMADIALNPIIHETANGVTPPNIYSIRRH